MTDLFAAAGIDDWRHTTIDRPWGPQEYRAAIFAGPDAFVEVKDAGSGSWVRVTDRRTIDAVLHAIEGIR